MHFSIDVVFIDAEQVVMRIEHGLRPFKTASCRGAREVVELAAGECERRGLAAGDRIAWASRSSVTNVISTGDGLTAAAERRGTVLIASGDQRFVKLARFHLEGRGIAVGDESLSVALSGSLADAGVDVALLDGSTSLGDGLRALNAIRVQNPELPVVLVVEAPGKEALDSVRVYDKWQETEAAIDAVEQAVLAATP
jgi:CheY-like chemotaxis protein